MSKPTRLQKPRDFAYACFLLISVTILLITLGPLLPDDLIEPGVFGFLILIPLTVASFIAFIAGASLTIGIGRNDPVLIRLLILTGLILLLMVAAASGAIDIDGVVMVTNVLATIYGVTVLGVGAYWFAARRNRPE